jgi:hypothetical protein
MGHVQGVLTLTGSRVTGPAPCLDQKREIMFYHIVEPVIFTAFGYVACLAGTRVRAVRNVYKGMHATPEGSREDAPELDQYGTE